MATSATLKLDDKEYPLPLMVGTEGEKAIDTRSLRAATGHIAYDQGYGNTGSCESNITYLDGDNGILRHRGYPIEQLAQHSDYVETAYLVIYGQLPNAVQRKEFGLLLRKQAAIETQMQRIFEGFPKDAPPMAMLSSIVASLAAHYPQCDLGFARDGLQAVLQVERRRPDLVITDLAMPHDGFRLLRLLRAEPEYASIRLAVLTGLTPAQIKRQGGLPADVAYFPKPLPLDRFGGYMDAFVQAHTRR